MLFEDNYGKLWHPEEVNELSPHEIEERGIHVWNEREAYA